MSDPPGSRLVHQAFLYGSPDDFVAAMAPFVREGLEQGDTVFAATKRSNIEALREELGRDSALVDFEDAAEWHTRPYDRLQAFKRLIDEVPDGAILRAMGEPVWNGSDAVVRQWARYESVINVALADCPMLFVCLYDGEALPDEILDYAARTHPEQVQNGSAMACSAFVPPEEFIPGSPATPPQTIPELPPQGAEFRRILADQALDAGLPRESVVDFVIAANEVATNAVKYGRPPISAYTWTQGDELICQVADAGPGIADPLAGWVPPTPTGNGGWGLPIARQLCDALEIVPSKAGTTVTLHVSLGNPGAAQIQR